MIFLKKAAAWAAGFFLSLLLTVLIIRIPVMFVMDHVSQTAYLPMRLILLGLFALSWFAIERHVAGEWGGGFPRTVALAIAALAQVLALWIFTVPVEGGSVIFLDGLIYEDASKSLLKYACRCGLIPMAVAFVLGMTPAFGYVAQSFVIWQESPHRGFFFSLFLAPTVVTTVLAGRRRRSAAKA